MILRLPTIRFISVLWRSSFSPNITAYKEFIMAQHAFGGLSDDETAYIFYKHKLGGV